MVGDVIGKVMELKIGQVTTNKLSQENEEFFRKKEKKIEEERENFKFNSGDWPGRRKDVGIMMPG